MQCDGCDKREATVYLTQVISGQVQKIQLCHECAEQSGLGLASGPSLTEALYGTSSEEELRKDAMEKSCPKCHLRRSDFRKTSRLGCPACYTMFATELEGLFKSIHKSTKHEGKIPASRQMTSQETMMQQRLQHAISKQDFEEAAKLRDLLAAAQSTPGKRRKNARSVQHEG